MTARQNRSHWPSTGRITPPPVTESKSSTEDSSMLRSPANATIAWPSGCSLFCSMEAARQLANDYQCHVVVTLGRHGLVGAELAGATWYLPARPVDIRDVCGAGDTVLVAFGATVLAVDSLLQAARRASVAAAHQIFQAGTSSVSATHGKQTNERSTSLL